MTQTIITAAGASDALSLTPGNDGTLVVQVGPTGAKVNALSFDAAGQGTLLKPLTGQLTLGTAQATTSGNTALFSGIPSWAKRITLMLNGFSTNGTANPLIQIGSGSIDATGYLSSSTAMNGSGVNHVPHTTGFGLRSVTAASLQSGHIVLTLLGSNIWVCSGTIINDLPGNVVTGGSKTLSGILDRVQLITTDTFDAGSVNIIYEG